MIHRFSLKRAFLPLLFCGIGSFTASGQVTLNIDAGQRGATIGERHYGIFFEEINHAGDGGLYAELIQNRSFEDNAGNPDHWQAVGKAGMSLVTQGLMNEAQEHALQVELTASGDGISNGGFWGIHVVNGQTYRLSFWIKAASGSYDGTLTAELQDADGTPLGSTPVSVEATEEWSKVTAEITATGDANAGRFALTASKPGTICLDMVSLFPPTFNGRENGCRIDLAEKLAAMKPAFVRFPGGCFVEGIYANEKTNRFEWKKTIGPIEERPGHMNQNWGYRVTDGLGFHELLQLTEDLGAEPLFVVNMGMGHGWYEEYTQIGEYIQEALDAIEYCNGDATTTKWGALRAANGHPEPFNLKLIEIGNENYNFTSENNSDQSDHYAERYYQFYTAIKEKYPDITVIGNVEAWGTDNPSWRNAYPVDAVDEHYYRNPAWFVNQYSKYDSYSRSNYKIYVGEYAVTQDFGVNGNLNAALGEAVFMQGMENNSDICIMNSYAPIFVNENNAVWRPDMIRFNSYTSYGTPSYYVQQLFPNNVGKQNVKWTEENNRMQSTANQIGLSTWLTSATFDNVQVTTPEGTVLFSDDFSSAKPEWQTNGGGNWGISGGALQQTNTSVEGPIYACTAKWTGDSYIYEVDATKNSGAEGFLIVFNYEDDQNYCWWNLGGWGNTQHGVEVCTNGNKTTVASTSGSLETGRTYHIKIHVSDTHIRCYLDNVLIHDFNLPMQRKIYVSSNIDDEAGILYLKLVNPNATPQTATINLANATITDGSSVIVLSGNDGMDENSLENPDRVTPKESALDGISGQQFTYEVPAYSLHILRLKVDNVQLAPEKEAAELPEALVQYSFGGSTPADDSGQFTGKLQGNAAIVEMNDGNKALFTGTAMPQSGYLDLGTDLARQVLSELTGDYSVSVDLLLPETGSLNQYCWAYSFANGTDQYLGMVNTSGNTNWYYTIKDIEGSTNVAALNGLSYGTWHNLLYVQNGNMGQLYVNGQLTGENDVRQRPADIAQSITEATLGRSPFAEDALMSGVFFDNFRIYGEALQPEQAQTLYAQARKLSTASDETTRLADNDELENFLKKFNFLHATTTLPETTQGETAISWTFVPTAEAEGTISLEGNELKVERLPKNGQPLTAGLLTATLQSPGGEATTMTQQVTIAPDDNRYGYLYCFMNSASEITNFALGTKEEQGKLFNVLLNGAEVFDTEQIAAIEHGTRDAYIGRGEGEDGYFIATTDMKVQTSGVWHNRGIDLVRSKDLIHWESSSFDFTLGKKQFADSTETTGIYNTDEEYARINRVWAPQFIWDKDYNQGQGGYLVYYSLLSSNEGDTHDRIFYSYTDREFRTLTQPRLLFDPGVAVIDADIIYNPYDSLYHMFYKREGASGTARGIYEATSERLTGGTWTDILHITNEGGELVEGPTAVRRINEDTYNLYYMRYSGGSAYKYCETDHLGLNVSFASPLQGTGAFQHGSVMTVTEEEYTILKAWNDIEALRPYIETMQAESGSEIFTRALAQADEALALTSIDELATALPAAYEAMKQSTRDYIDELCSGTLPEGGADLTFLLENPDFTEGSAGWSGTSFTQATAGVAEFYDKTFDAYQLLTDMPAGTYRFECQGFYRYGDYGEAYPMHINGTERILSSIYLNDCAEPFLSLFDDNTPYTYSPYTYPNDVWSANSAFNADRQYRGNSVECTLQERGDLRLGIVQSEYRYHDWTCFDNFRLYYIGDGSTDGISAPQQDAATPQAVDVYTIDGLLLRKAVRPAEAVQGLPKGIYIVGAQKVVID